MSCPRAPSFLGAYVLDVLDPAERRDADEHLATCPACAAELAEFRGLTAQLDRVPAEEVTAEPVRPSPELFGRVQAAVRRPARRRWAAVAASAAVLGAAGITWVAVSGDEEQVRIATAGSIRVAVLPQERNEGTALDITVDGLDRGDYCMLVVTDEGGGQHPAGEWTVPGGRVSYDIWTEVPRDSLDEVVLLGSGGVEVLRVPVGD